MSEQMSFEGFANGTVLLVSGAGQSPCASPDGQTIAKSSPRRARASRSAKRAKAPDSVTTGIYGPVRTPSSVISAPKSAWESRLMDLLGTLGSTERELTWKRLDTASGRSYSQLAVSTPRRVDIAGFGLPVEPSADAKLWSAIQSRDGDARGSQGKRFLHPDRSNDLPAEVAAITEHWPIVSARDWKSDSSIKTGEELYGTKGKPLARTALEVARGDIGTQPDGSSDPTATSELAPSRLGVSPPRPGGSLHSAMAGWLQGYSQAHLNCAPSCLPKAGQTARRKSKATETPSCPK